MIKRLVVGNWKMNGLGSTFVEVSKLSDALDQIDIKNDVLLCPPATLLAGLSQKFSSSKLAFGGQDCHSQASGPYTGDISAEMLRDAGATCVILGHSERRIRYNESSSAIKKKAAAAHRAGLNSIICVGETLDERQKGLAIKTIDSQLTASLPSGCNANNVTVAYEPVWAIGTGLTPSVHDVGGMHTHIRDTLSKKFKNGEKFRLIYGGSVKPENVSWLAGADNVDGVLVGGASIRAKDFLEIIVKCGVVHDDFR
ncbi:MAG TPA: Triosephosphate isomerase [Hyphomicrobiaceae bacterium MAG_BT-2024]